ncbi:hypothetical protein GCM10023091_31600 [Ravibacter arvi]|uniref:Glycosyltransferase n=1 Tax=Ravibacter arvi TaxID=2051041 RepID=A0ABP8M2I9_9BACT
MSTPVSIALIISTYNWPEALELCLRSVAHQSVLPDEVIIADDGSDERTARVIDRMRPHLPVPLVHIWQPDDGFRLGKIRNKAIAAASKSYIIQIDGDLILHRHFVSDHIRLSEPGTFVTGSRVILLKSVTEKLLAGEKKRVYLLENGIKNRLNGLHASWMMQFLATRYKADCIRKLRGCNMAFWREDLVRVNGYNEAFGYWGREDNEIAARLLNIGIRKRMLKFGGIVFHLYHNEQSRAGYEENEKLLTHTITRKLTRCEQGLDQYGDLVCDNQPLISIIMVTRNAAHYLQRCLDSIFRQQYSSLELIVMDGASTDGTIAILEANAARISYWKSEKDLGIYDAMNKAIGRASGNWVYFIGADDQLSADFSKFATELKDNKKIYYGSVWKNDKKYLGHLSAYHQAKTGINHQAIVYPMAVFRKYRYDLAYAISADHVLNMWCWKDPEFAFEFRDYVIATFNTTGISSLSKDVLFEQQKARLIHRHYGVVIWLRFLFKCLKENLRSSKLFPKRAGSPVVYWKDQDRYYEANPG